MKTPTLLIVDDMKFDRTVISKILSRKMDCKMLSCSGGAEALTILANEKVDLVLADVEMPNMSGDEFVREIRKNQSLAELPIIMVSAFSQEESVIKCLQAGANDYLIKPLRSEVAATRILTHLRLSESITDRIKLQNLSSLNAMITTYNHQINNPLAVAMGNLELVELAPENPVPLSKVKNALIRIAEIVKSIQAITEKDDVIYEPYGASNKMVKLK